MRKIHISDSDSKNTFVHFLPIKASSNEVRAFGKEKVFSKRLLISGENNDYENLVNVICDGIVNREDIEHCKKVILQTLNEDVNLKYMDMNNIIETIIKLSYKYNVAGNIPFTFCKNFKTAC